MVKTFLNIPNDSDFSIHNIPFGIISSSHNPNKRCATRIGDFVLDLAELHRVQLFFGFDSSVFEQPTLNAFMALGRGAWLAARYQIQQLLSERNPTLTGSVEFQRQVLIPISEVTVHLPAQIGDYTDFYSSIEHATNVGIMLRGRDNALQPNWKHLPVGYHGRSSSVTITGHDVIRPRGQIQTDRADPSKGSNYSPCRQLDFELEMGFFVGGPSSRLGYPVPISEADDHIFGMVLLNDWSARDIQAWEYVPLGPFTAKNFITTISPWVVTLDALAPYRCSTSVGVQDPVPHPYLRDSTYSSFNINLEVSLIPHEASVATVISRSNLRNMYWTMKQQLAHHTVTGCNINAGDLMGSGTISGQAPDSYGSMLELCWKGEKDIICEGAGPRKFLQDGDTVQMRGFAVTATGERIGFGECDGRILPALV